MLTGSAASATSNPLSDRDLEIHVRDVAILQRDDSWWNALGKVIAVERLGNGDGPPTRLVYYVGGKLDFTLIDIRDERGDYDRPFKVLVDKDGDAASFNLVAAPVAIPNQAAFDECVNWGYAAAIMAAKAIARDEPWSVKIRDGNLKTELLRMIEWDHGMRYGGRLDVRYLGTRMRGWMDSDVQERLERCWARFDLADSRRALLDSVDLFRDLAARTAAGKSLKDFDHDAARSEVARILKKTAVA